MDVHYATGLQHKLPYQAVCYSFVDVANIDGSLLVLLPVDFVRFGFGERMETYQCRAPDILVVIWRFGGRVVGELEVVARRVEALENLEASPEVGICDCRLELFLDGRVKAKTTNLRISLHHSVCPIIPFNSKIW